MFSTYWHLLNLARDVWVVCHISCCFSLSSIKYSEMPDALKRKISQFDCLVFHLKDSAGSLT